MIFLERENDEGQAHSIHKEADRVVAKAEQEGGSLATPSPAHEYERQEMTPEEYTPRVGKEAEEIAKEAWETHEKQETQEGDLQLIRLQFTTMDGRVKFYGEFEDPQTHARVLSVLHDAGYDAIQFLRVRKMLEEEYLQKYLADDLRELLQRRADARKKDQ